MEIPAWVDSDAWDGFVEMRKHIKKPLSSRAIKLAINMLEKLKNQGHDPNEVLDQSTFHSWQGLFPLMENKYGQENEGGGGTRRSEPKSFHARDVEEAERVKQAVRSRLGFPRRSAGLGAKSDESEINRRRTDTVSNKVINILEAKTAQGG